MGFTIFYYEDLGRDDFFNLLNQLIKSEYLKTTNSLVFCCQSHGNFYQNQTIMEFSDGSTTSVESVIEKFSNTSCEYLALKPKVFLFPFCRGGISDLEKKVKLYNIQTDGHNNVVPSFSDILICYGTVPGFRTHRDTSFGSWYISELCKVFAEHACDLHIEEMLKMISAKTMEKRDAGRLQVASWECRGFDRLLYFNPKISENN